MTFAEAVLPSPALAAVRSPRKALSVLRALARGQLVRLSCRLRGVRFTAGKDFRVYGKISVRGPGRVIFGNHVTIGEGTITTPWTNSPEAIIRVGDYGFLNGARFSCVREITLGPRCMVGRSGITDTNFHSTAIDRHNPHALVRVAPVHIGANVWIAGRVSILPGTMIGDNSVIGLGSICSGEYPANVVVAPPRTEVVRRLKE